MLVEVASTTSTSTDGAAASLLLLLVALFPVCASFYFYFKKISLAIYILFRLSIDTFIKFYLLPVAPRRLAVVVVGRDTFGLACSAPMLIYWPANL